MLGDDVGAPANKKQELLNILFFNTDRRSKTLHDILLHAKRCKSRIIGLAETSQGINENLAASFNFVVIRCPSLAKVNYTTILLHKSLIPNLVPALNWGHDSGRASAITLNTKHGHMSVGALYCPHGIDSINNKDPSNILYQQAADLHADVNKRLNKSPISILLADMNETNNSLGRISRSLVNRTINVSASATEENESILAGHMHSHVDAMQLLHKE
jgi:hypothetical protein